jgi:magnesium transporter
MNMNEPATTDTIASLLIPPVAVFDSAASVGAVIETLRDLVQREFVTYGFVVDEHRKLQGIVVMRDLLFSSHETPIVNVMLKQPFFLRQTTSILDAMREAIVRHFPVYPVCDDTGVLVGELRGSRLFEAQAVELSAQAGSMVGVEKEERVYTRWTKSFRYRHPWLQLNLVTAFVAGGIVNCFQGTIDKYVILASFLPVLAGQSGNTGSQALAVTIRGLTLGDFSKIPKMKVLMKETLLGVLNGFFVGLIAGAAMYFLAKQQGNPAPHILGGIVVCAMMVSCMMSGLCGAMVPMMLKKLGADPATASSIFLTTATDIMSMGMLLSLATMLLS